ncbi:gastricsin-like [Periplaneta americana]|uniref:gastricsin-like n=1 Tax=Periplaneta americana TaxID=6978 RepID=UPI0037E8B7F2
MGRCCILTVLLLVCHAATGDSDVIAVPMKNFYQGSYIVPMKIGSQDFKVQLDTGSSDTFVPSITCTNCGNHTKFACKNPSKQLVNVTYGTGVVTGRFCRDTIQLGGLVVEDHEFLVLEDEAPGFRNQPYDGIVGMGFICDAATFAEEDGVATHLEQPLFAALVEQNSIGNAFSFYMTWTVDEQSRVFLGGSNPDYYYGQLQHVEVVPHPSEDCKEDNYLFWIIPLDRFLMGNRLVWNSKIPALIDSGTSMVTVPESLCGTVKQVLASAIGASPKEFSLNNKISCSYRYRLPTLKMRMGNLVFELEPTDYLVYYGNGQCVMYIQCFGDFFIMGDVFFRRYYVEYNMADKTIGFARSKAANWVQLIG